MRQYETREACFACTTPYQVIGAISITINHKLNADLYIFGMFRQYEKVADNIRKQGIFGHVYAVDCSRIGAPGKLRGLKQMLFAEQTVSFYLPAEIRYQHYYSSSRALPKIIMQHVLQKRNPDMIRVIYEDGMGTYSSDSHPLNPTKTIQRTERVLNWNLDNPRRTRMMAYVPELVEPPAYLQGIHVEQMPRLDFSSATANMLETVFDVREENRIHQKWIIFDTLRRYSADMQETEFAILDDSYRAIVSAGGNDIICKPHPRSVFESKAQIALYPDSGIPMEVLYARMDDLENRILISYTSSAVFTPKIMFGMEPVVISLHRLLSGTRGSGIFEGIYQKFRGIYADQDRVMAPDSIEELTECVRRIR